MPPGFSAMPNGPKRGAADERLWTPGLTDLSAMADRWSVPVDTYKLARALPWPLGHLSHQHHCEQRGYEADGDNDARTAYDDGRGALVVGEEVFKGNEHWRLHFRDL